MRILHLATFVQGGAGLTISTLAAEQVRRDHAVELIVSRTGAPGYGNYPEHLDRVTAAGIRPRLVDSLFDRRPEAHLAVARTIDDLGGAAAFDVIHAHAAVPAAIAQSAIARAGTAVPLVQTMHGWGVAKTPAQCAHDVAVMNRVDRLVVPARAALDHLRALGVTSPRLAVVPYGVAPDTEDNDRDEHLAAIGRWRDEGRLVIGCIGTLGARKNQHLLVEAMALLGTEVGVRLALVGDGPDADLRALVEARGLGAAVRFCGYQPRARRYLRATDVLVLPSRNEGQPLAVLEAFCAGVPVIASRIPELEELVDDSATGWLVEPTAAALAATLARAASPTGRARLRAMGVRARQTYRDTFTVDRMVDAYLEEYARAS